MKRKQTAFGRTIQTKLKEIGMTQVEFARKIGTTKQWVNDMIHRGKEPGTRTIRKVYAALGLESPV